MDGSASFDAFRYDHLVNDGSPSFLRYILQLICWKDFAPPYHMVLLTNINEILYLIKKRKCLFQDIFLGFVV